VAAVKGMRLSNTSERRVRFLVNGKLLEEFIIQEYRGKRATELFYFKTLLAKRPAL